MSLCLITDVENLRKFYILAGIWSVKSQRQADSNNYMYAGDTAYVNLRRASQLTLENPGPR